VDDELTLSEQLNTQKRQTTYHYTNTHLFFVSGDNTLLIMDLLIISTSELRNQQNSFLPPEDVPIFRSNIDSGFGEKISELYAKINALRISRLLIHY